MAAWAVRRPDGLPAASLMDVFLAEGIRGETPAYWHLWTARFVETPAFDSAPALVKAQAAALLAST